jgi:hypothetical protein
MLTQRVGDYFVCGPPEPRGPRRAVSCAHSQFI